MDPAEKGSEQPKRSEEPVSSSDDLSIQQTLKSLEQRLVRLEQTVGWLAERLAPGYIEAARTEAPAPAPIKTSSSTEIVPPAFLNQQAEKPAKASLEDRLGAQVFYRIGIVALLLGATWFLKLAMDNRWIGPLGRVLVGLVAGAGLVVWSERFRRQGFAAFSYSLKAVGSGVLYLSLWAAFRLYHLLPAPLAFALMIAIAAWNAFMAWSQISELLAVYALAGAFATPLLLSTGGNHQVFLFSYLLAIDLVTALLVRVQQRRPNPWPSLLLIALPATAVYFIGWFFSWYSADQILSTSLFLAAFFLVFLTIPIAPDASDLAETSDETRRPSETLAHRSALQIADILLPLANALFFSFALYQTLQDGGQHDALPWCALLLAAVYLGLTQLPQRPPARAIHLSLAVVFLTIAIPLKASGAAISLAWLAEAVMLLWAANHFEADGMRAEASPQDDPVPITLRRLATAALLLGFVGLILHPLWIYPSPSIAVFNGRFATALAGLLAFAAATAIGLLALHREAGEAESGASATSREGGPHWLQIAAGSVIAFNLVALEAGVLEIGTLWYRAPTHALYSDSRLETALSISAFFALYGAGLLAAGFVRRNGFLRWQGLILLLVAIAKTFLYDIRSLSAGYRVVSFLGLGVLLMAVSFAYQKDWLSLRDQPHTD